MNVFKLAFANIRKRKGSSITFLVMMILSSLMLTNSFMLLIGVSGFYENKVDELNAPHFTSLIDANVFDRHDFKGISESFHGTTDASVVEALTGISEWEIQGETRSAQTVVLLRHSQMQDNFFNPPIIDRLASRPADSIVLPLAFRSGGSRPGEQIHLSLGSERYTFTIYGFFEDPIGGASTSDIAMAYVSDEVFDTIVSEDAFIAYKMLMVRLSSTNLLSEFHTFFLRHSDLGRDEVIIVTFNMSEAAATAFISIVSMMLIVFALIVLIIAFIVVVFSIKSSIDEDIATIGTMKSIGYKSKYLRATQFVQYILIALTGILLGIFFAKISFPFIGNIIASTSGILWLSGFDFLSPILALLVIIVLTSLVVFISTMRYRSITPINALRSTKTKSKKRNPLPLEKGRLPLDVHLGAKRFLSSLKNNVTLTIVITLLVFVSLLVNVMNFNLNTNRTAMLEMVGLEMADIYVVTTSGFDIYDFNETLLAREEVDTTLLSGGRTAIIGGFIAEIEVMEDFSKLTMNTIIRGRNPVADGEIALGATSMRQVGKSIGDSINVEIAGVERTYTIVGINQSIATAGEGGRIVLPSVLHHAPNFNMDTILIYLNQGVDVYAFINMLNLTYGNSILVIGSEETMDTILSSLGDPVSMLFIIMMVANVIIIAFILFLIISTLIRKAKREFGILKAIGYRNNQLILQLLLSLLPSLILGTLLGLIMGFVLSNPLLTMMFSGMGLLEAHFIIPGLSSVLISFIILGAGVLATYLISFKLRAISPQKLISE